MKDLKFVFYIFFSFNIEDLKKFFLLILDRELLNYFKISF